MTKLSLGGGIAKKRRGPTGRSGAAGPKVRPPPPSWASVARGVPPWCPNGVPMVSRGIPWFPAVARDVP
eukprot:8226975-Pyramimonas_sp.AAC.1